jgi:Na+-translocating ferredoxin:NAD+ oxidoreductase RnfC subunit
MMGSESVGVVLKTTTSLIVLSRDHRLIKYKNKTIEKDIKIARSACEGCRFCTDLCPRFLIGHKLEPHAIMAMVSYQAPERIAPEVVAQAYLCCQCGLCGMYACPTMLSPERVIRNLISTLRSAKVPPIHRRTNVSPHPERDYRRPPVDALVSRLELEEYDRDAPIEMTPVETGAVRVPLKQHVGVPCRPVVAKGDKVKVGDLIGIVPDGQLGAPIHAGIAGSVTAVSEESIGITA